MVNYNVLLHTQDMQACRSIAKAVSTRGGGLPAVEAMGLQHDGGKALLMLMPGDEPPLTCHCRRAHCLIAQCIWACRGSHDLSHFESGTHFLQGEP